MKVRVDSGKVKGFQDGLDSKPTVLEYVDIFSVAVVVVVVVSSMYLGK